jgi:hypothetical protein
MSRSGSYLLCASLLIVALAGEIAVAQPPAAERTSVATAAELLDLFGLDDDFFQKFRDGRSWQDDEHDPLARVLVRLSQVKPIDLARWTKRGVKPGDVASDPEKFSRQLIHLLGRVRRVERIKTSVELQDRYDLEMYYRCELVGKDLSAVVFAANIPASWKLDAPISEAASVDALFLKRGPQDEGRGQAPYFAAARVAWHPDTLLGELGMDYGLFDTVRHDRAILDAERECFYQVLAAAGRAPAEALDEAVENVADATSRLVALMARPEAHEGELHSFRGVARRAVKIHVSDAETVARLGFDHYFELVVFVDLDGYQMIAGKKVNNHPVVFCLRELPADMPTGENIAEMVRASGFMFKKWRYMTQLTGEKGDGVSVASPLLIGKTAVWERDEQAQRRFDPVVAALVAAALVCIGLFAWWYCQRERRIHGAVLAGRRTISDRASLDNLEIDSIDAATDLDRD